MQIESHCFSNVWKNRTNGYVKIITNKKIL